MEKSSITFGEALRFLWHYWRRTPRTIVLMTGGIIAAVCCDLAVPFAARAVSEAVGRNQSGEALQALGVLLGLGVSFTVLWQLGYRCHERQITVHMQDMAQDAFRHVQEASADWHANTFAGSTVRKITRGFWAFAMLSDTLVSGVLGTVILLPGSLLLMAFQWPLMGLGATLSVLLYLTVAVLLSRYYVSPASQKAVAQDTALSAVIADAVTCNATVRTFGAEEREQKRLATSLDTWRSLTLFAWMRSLNTNATLAILSQINLLAILGTPLLLWHKGWAAPADVTYALAAFFVLQGPIRNVSAHVKTIQRAVNDLEDVVMLSRMPRSVADRREAAPATFTRGEIRFHDVTFHYPGQSTPLYTGLNVWIRPGETVGLVGASGSGKTTFIKLLQRLYDVQSGQVLVDGQDVRHPTQSSLRRHIALVPQDPALFHRSLLENIRYARPEATMEQVVEAARQANAHDFIARLPLGYDTLVGERGVKLSGGERQRVAIARALLADAPILVLDEATSSLDSVSERLIQEALDRLMLGRTSLVVAHRLSTLRSVDRILVFDRGRIVEDGTHHALLQKEGGAYRRLHDTQTLGLTEPVDAV